MYLFWLTKMKMRCVQHVAMETMFFMSLSILNMDKQGLALIIPLYITIIHRAIQILTHTVTPRETILLGPPCTHLIDNILSLVGQFKTSD